MVEMEYEEERALEDGTVGIYTWKAVFNDEEAAIAQAGQDIAEGRNPVRVKEHGEEAQRRGATAPRMLINTEDLRRRAREHGQSIF